MLNVSLTNLELTCFLKQASEPRKHYTICKKPNKLTKYQKIRSLCSMFTINLHKIEPLK